MMDFLGRAGMRIQQINAAERKSPACEDRSLERTRVVAGASDGTKNKAVDAV
jgi:hypothetical protein